MEKSITSGQEKQIVRFTVDAAQKAAEEVVANLPLDKDATQEAVIEKGDEFQAALIPGFSAIISQVLAERTQSFEVMKASILIKAGGSNPYFDQQFDYWMNLWRTKLGIKNPNFAGIAPFIEHPGYRPFISPRLELVAPQQYLYDCCKERFDGHCWKWYDGLLDDVVIKNICDPRASAHVFWYRDRVEADKELKNLSAIKLEEMKIPGITLFYRFLFEYDHFDRTGGHLDINNITLCSGSRCGLGDVPGVSWSGGGMGVNWCNPQSAHDLLRSRQQFLF